MNDSTEVNHPWGKLAVSWAATAYGYLGIHTWQDFSAMAASALSCLFIFDWVWKRFIKVYLINRGVIKGSPRNYMDTKGTTHGGDSTLG